MELLPDNDSALMEAIYYDGPTSIIINAQDTSAFQFYSSGVYTENCPSEPNHAVIAVGYGTSGGQNYWRVRNSWGASWGNPNKLKLIC